MTDRYLSGNALVCGDCLDVMRELPDECVDLVYLDPPFNSNAFYVAAFGDKGLVNQQLRDVWRWTEATQRTFDRLPHGQLRDSIEGVRLQRGRRSSMAAYILYTGVRLEEMRRVLKPTGSVYLHCDPHANAYLRVLMDAVFGDKQFRNEIVWNYRKVSNSKARKFLRAHDCIFFYAKSSSSLYHPLFETELSPRKQQLIERGYNTKNMNDERYLYVYDNSKVQLLESRGRIDRTAYDHVVYIDTTKGNRLTDVFDIDFLNSQATEKTGYPTQKPRALLERIISSSSNPGDLVLDSFCGCGTAAAATSLGRGYLGIDISGIAVRVMEQRLTSRGHAVAPEVYGLRWDDITWADFERRALRGREESEDGAPGWAWAEDMVAALLNGVPNQRKTGDDGVDVRYYGAYDLEAKAAVVVPIQVKTWRRDRTVGRPQGDSLLGVQTAMQREGKHAPMSMMVSLYPPAGSLRAFAAAQGEVEIRTEEEGLRAYPRMQALSIQEMLQRDERPMLPPVDPRSLVGDTQTRMTG